MGNRFLPIVEEGIRSPDLACQQVVQRKDLHGTVELQPLISPGLPEKDINGVFLCGEGREKWVLPLSVNTSNTSQSVIQAGGPLVIYKPVRQPQIRPEHQKPYSSMVTPRQNEISVWHTHVGCHSSEPHHLVPFLGLCHSRELPDSISMSCCTAHLCDTRLVLLTKNLISSQGFQRELWKICPSCSSPAAAVS